MSDVLRIGYVLKPQGVRGELKIEPLTDDPNRFSDLDEVILMDRKGNESVFTIEKCAVRQGFAYLVLAGLSNRDQVENLRSAYVCIPREKAIQLPQGHHFICDLIGCEVQLDNGETLGVLKEILQHGAADVYRVKGKRSCMFPALKRLIQSEDIENKQIVVDRHVLAEVVVWDED